MDSKVIQYKEKSSGLSQDPIITQITLLFHTSLIQSGLKSTADSVFQSLLEMLSIFS